MEEERRITKVSIKGDSVVEIEWEQEGAPGRWHNRSLECHEKADPKFYKAFEGLRPHVPELCELPDTKKDDIDVTAVTIIHKGEEADRTVKIAATRKLQKSKGRLGLRTPAKLWGVPNDKSNRCLPNGAQTIMKRLCEAAERYIDGEREQIALDV